MGSLTSFENIYKSIAEELSFVLSKFEFSSGDIIINEAFCKSPSPWPVAV